jgi:hypothetical protein
MSGGSYRYICWDEVDQLIQKTTEIQQMADRLSRLGYAKDAARETYELLLIIRQFETRVDVIKDRLSGVWKAVEWWDSMDSNEDAVKEALSKYRGEATLEGNKS